MEDFVGEESALPLFVIADCHPLRSALGTESEGAAAIGYLFQYGARDLI